MKLRACERIRRRADFQQAYEHGARVHGRYSTLFILPNKLDAEGRQQSITPEDVAGIRDYVLTGRGSLDEFEIVVEGKTPGDNPTAGAAIVRPWAEAGATWWTEADWRQPVERLQERVAAGPPRSKAG